MKKITEIWTVLTGTYQFGTHFQKGDYIPVVKSIMAKTMDGTQIELDRNKILEFVGGVNITDKKLLTLIGKSAEMFKK